MRFIYNKFKLGRQEDAHEFLRMFVESMVKQGDYNKTNLE